MESISQETWRTCSSCKKPITLGARYYICSVSTCNNLRTGYVFCNVPCFERHLPVARHRDAGAIEKVAPKTKAEADATATPNGEPRRFVAGQKSGQTPAASTSTREVLVIASRLKEYIFARSEYSTSGAVMDVLSDHLRIICDRAIDHARSEGRKTVMDRDFDFLKKG